MLVNMHRGCGQGDVLAGINLEIDAGASLVGIRATIGCPSRDECLRLIARRVDWIFAALESPRACAGRRCECGPERWLGNKSKWPRHLPFRLGDGSVVDAVSNSPTRFRRSGFSI